MHVPILFLSNHKHTKQRNALNCRKLGDVKALKDILYSLIFERIIWLPNNCDE